MFRHILAALMLTSLIVLPAAAQQYDTPRSWDAIRIEPCADELNVTGGVWIGKLGKEGYNLVDLSFYSSQVSVAEYFHHLQLGYGFWFQNSHADQSSYVIKLFTSESARNDTLDSYSHTSYGQYLEGGFTPSGLPVIAITPAGIKQYFYSWNSVIMDAGCYAGTFNSSWTNARAVLGYTYQVDNTTVFADANLIIANMVGENGASKRPLSAAVAGLTITATGNLSTVTNPSIVWTSPTNGASVSHSTPLVIKFDCPVRLTGSSNYAVFSSGGVALSNFGSSDSYTMSGYVGPWTRGTGAVVVRSFNPVASHWDGVQGATGGVGLDADGYQDPSDLVISLLSTVDNPAASLSALNAIRQSDGALISWRVESQSGTNRYLLFRSSALLGPWEYVATVPADSLRWDYSVADLGITNAVYELREVENKGDTLVLGNAELRDPFVIPIDQPATESLADSLSQANGQQFNRATMQPNAILPYYDITYVLPVDPTGDWTRAVQPLVADRTAKGYLVNIITMDQVGNTRDGLHNYIIQANRYGLRGATLCASDEDSRSWNKYPWINGWVQQSWPGHPEWALIPMWDWPDPIGVQLSSISWFRPGMTSDMPYGDVTGDSIPEIPVTRIPATNPAGLTVAVTKILAYERQDLAHGAYLIADQGRSYNGESGSWASALADSFAAAIPSSLTKIRIRDTDAAPLTHPQVLTQFISAITTYHVVGATLTGTALNRNKWHLVDRTQGDSWSSLYNGTFLSAVAAPTCELAGTDRRVDPSYSLGLASTSFNNFPNQAPAWIWASNNGSHQGANSDLGRLFFHYIYQTGCWSGAAGAQMAVYDAAHLGFEKYQALGTEILGDVCSPFPGQVIRTTDVERSNTNHLRLAVDRNPNYGHLGVTFSLPTNSSANVSIFDLQGRRVATLADGILMAGMHRVIWNSSSVSGGMYFLRLASPLGTIIQKVTFLR